MAKWLQASALAVGLAIGGPAAAQIDSNWPEVAYASDGRCAISVTGNGQTYRIGITGLEPGEAGRYLLTNGDMTPIDWSIRADGNGGFARYYLPFRWHRDGGTVSVSVTTADCAVTAAFPWRRAEVKVS
jgi:hypothetical protein